MLRNWIGHEEHAQMIELNLLEKKEPFRLPTVLGIDLSHLNFKMLFISILILYIPEYFIRSYFESAIHSEEEVLTKLSTELVKVNQEINKNKTVKAQLEAYNKQVVKLQLRSSQVDEILKIKTNPKKILEKIARSIPEEMWFDKLQINENKDVIISGGSYNSRSIGEFITLINDSPFFGNSVTPIKQENKKEVIDEVLTTYELYELKGKIKNYDMRSK